MLDAIHLDEDFQMSLQSDTHSLPSLHCRMERGELLTPFPNVTGMPRLAIKTSLLR
jgi:hypothetical protein